MTITGLNHVSKALQVEIQFIPRFVASDSAKDISTIPDVLIEAYGKIAENTRSIALNIYKVEESKLSELSRLKPYSIGASY